MCLGNSKNIKICSDPYCQSNCIERVIPINNQCVPLGIGNQNATESCAPLGRLNPCFLKDVVNAQQILSAQLAMQMNGTTIPIFLSAVDLQLYGKVGNCQELVNRFINGTRPEVVTLPDSYECNYLPDDPEFATDPCCSTTVAQTKCCAKRNLQRTIRAPALVPFNCTNPARVRALFYSYWKTASSAFSTADLNTDELKSAQAVQGCIEPFLKSGGSCQTNGDCVNSNICMTNNICSAPQTQTAYYTAFAKCITADGVPNIGRRVMLKRLGLLHCSRNSFQIAARS